MKTWRVATVAGAVGLSLCLLPRRANELTVLPERESPRTGATAASTTDVAIASARLATPPTSRIGQASFGTLPVQFVENRGQIAGSARFVVGWPHAPAWVTDSGLVISVARAEDSTGPRSQDLRTDDERAVVAATPLHGAHVALAFEGAAAGAMVESIEAAATHYSYFLGNDAARWVRGVPGSRRLRWSGLYPGISVELHGESGRLEYDIHLESGADLSQLVVRVDGAEGLTVQADGSLRIETAAGPIRQAQPPTWVVTPQGGTLPVACVYTVLDKRRFGFATGEGVTGRPLVIDPELQFGTFLGGSGGDDCFCVAVDSAGCPCLGGDTASSDFPATLGAFDTTIGTFKPDGFVAKLSPGGESLIYATYLGGNTSDESTRHIDVTETDDIVVSGTTGSPDFPTTPGSFDLTLNGETDSYITRLTADGSDLVYSTLVGGNDDDTIRGMALDAQERVCFAGQTRSPDFPVTPNAFQPVINPVFLDGMLGRLSADGTALDYSTFMPGTSDTWCLALDPEGRACVGGGADGFYLPTAGAFQTPLGEEFIYEFDFDAGSFVYAAKFGGGDTSFTQDLVVDGRGAVYACGYTYSFNFPTTPGAFDTTFNGESDAFVVKLSPDGSTLEFGTLLGGASFDPTNAIAIDKENRIVISGRTLSSNLPVTPDAFDQQLSRGDGAFLAQFSADGSQLLYSTYFGGTSYWGIPQAVTIDNLNDAIVVGYTHAPDFPTTPGSLMPNYGVGTANNGFVLKFAFGPWTNLGHPVVGTAGLIPTLLGDGTLEPGSAGSIALTQAKPLAPAYLLVGFTALDAPFKGGTMVPNPLLLIPLTTNAAGGLTLSWLHWPAGLPAGTELLLQYWIVDPSGPVGFSASNGLSAAMPVVFP